MEDIDNIVNILNQGGIVIFPTDTAYGIGCRIDKPEAVARLFKIRRRPETQATPALVDSIRMAKKYWLQINEEMVDLMRQYWPGALTIVYNCKKELVPELVRGKGENLGLRMPDQQALLELIGKVGVPILGPSANFHGETTPNRHNDIDQLLIKQVDAVMAGKDEEMGGVSTVVDCTVKPLKVIREGKIIL